MRKLTKYIRIKLLKTYSIFGRRIYIKHFCKVYKKYGVHFEGNPRYIDSSVRIDTSSQVTIGANTTIAADTVILTHDYSFDYGLIALNMNDVKHEKSIKKPVSIGSNTFIGQRCMILPGVTIGKNVIVGANSDVTRNIQDNVVCCGNPAKIVCTIEEYVEKKLIKDKDNIF